MDATVRRSPSFMVLDYIMELDDLVGPPPPEWESIYCSSKKAYGCGEHGQKLVEGLALYAHHRDSGLPSSLCIRLSDEAFRSIRAELGYQVGRVPSKGVISDVSQQLLVLHLTFRSYDNLAMRRYCLVYDSVDASLCMVPYIKHPLKAFYTATVIPLRAGKDHELALMAHYDRERSMDGALWCRLCVCTPATRAGSSSASDDDGGAVAGPWKLSEDLRFPTLSDGFSPDVTFSLQGKVFWADVSQGVAYCDLRARDGDLRFNFAKLPRAYRIHRDWSSDEPTEPLLMSRTIGCDGDSIKFIYIDRSHRRRGGEVVEVWTLDLDYGLWKKSEGVLWRELWKKVKFMMPTAELRDVEPQYPTLTPDGALCLLLRNTRRRRSSTETDFICSFDMRGKSLLAAERVVDYDPNGRLVMPYDFFTMDSPASSRKRKLPSVLGQMPEPKRRKSAERASRRRVCCRASCCGRDL